MKKDAIFKTNFNSVISSQDGHAARESRKNSITWDGDGHLVVEVPWSDLVERNVIFKRRCEQSWASIREMEEAAQTLESDVNLSREIVSWLIEV